MYDESALFGYCEVGAEPLLCACSHRFHLIIVLHVGAVSTESALTVIYWVSMATTGYCSWLLRIENCGHFYCCASMSASWHVLVVLERFYIQVFFWSNNAVNYLYSLQACLMHFSQPDRCCTVCLVKDLACFSDTLVHWFFLCRNMDLAIFYNYSKYGCNIKRWTMPKMLYFQQIWW